MKRRLPGRAALVALAASVAVASTPAWPQALRAGNPLDVLPPTPPDATGEVRVETAPAPTPAPDLLASSVTPTRFDIEGVRAIDFAPVAASFAPLVGKTVTVADLVAQASQATSLYREAGYPLSFFFVPPQDLAGGVVRVVAVEGHIAQVRIEGDPGRSAERIEAIAQVLTGEKPLRRATFERATALLGQLPGFTIEARVPMPATTDGAAVMTLSVKRRVVNVALGSELGRPQSRAVITGELNDTLLPGGQVSLSTLLPGSGHDRYVAAAATQPIGHDGLALRLSASLFETAPVPVAVGAATLDRTASSKRVEASISYPLVLTATRSLVASGGVYAGEARTTYTNAPTGAWLRETTRVNAAYAQLAYGHAEGDTAQSASAQLAHGFGGRSELTSNVPGAGGPLPGRTDFTRLVLQAADSRRWPGSFGTALNATAQLATRNLPDSERIGFGGSRFARGYAPGETAGDTGWGLGAEINRRFQPRESLQLEPYLLAEAAHVHPAAGGPANLRSLSLGMRVSDRKHYTVDVAASKPLGDPSPANPQRKPRASVLLTYKLGD